VGEYNSYLSFRLLISLADNLNVRNQRVQNGAKRVQFVKADNLVKPERREIS
jgi:hypothetical protein